MLRNALRMAKSSFKLLVRSRGFFLVIGIIIPIAATLLINLTTSGGVQKQPNRDDVVLLETMDTQIAYLENYNCLSVKVYDRCCNENTKELCERLTEAGIFQIFRTECAGVTIQQIEESAAQTALNDKVGAILILFDDENETKLYSVGEDERFELLQDALKLCMNTPGTVKANDEPVTTYITVHSNDDVDYFEIRHFSYCLAIASLAFVFGGVMILNTIINEKQDHVYSRIMLTLTTRSDYILSKGILVVALSLFQTLVMTVCFGLFVKADIGISVLQFALLVFLSGMIFSFLAVCTGMYVTTVFGAAFLAFALWSITTLISGAYFDISSASELYRKFALVMPQRWSFIAAQMMIRGDNTAYPLIFIVTTAYLIVILVAGVIGLKFNEEE